nr:splicing factor [Tanacetum cinerariifolium]
KKGRKARDQEASGVLSDRSSDEYYSSDEIEEFDDVDFHTEVEKNAQKDVTYPKHDPTILWNKMTLNLGMRYEHPEQLKQALANYGVANGYQLWYAKNDWRSLLVYCGRSVKVGRCSGKYSNKKKKIKKSLFPDEDAESSKSAKFAPKSSNIGPLESDISFIKLN